MDDRLRTNLPMSGGLADADFVPKPDVVARLRDAVCLLEAIEQGELFAGTPADAGDRRRHEVGLSTLAVLGRELGQLLTEVRAYEELAPALSPDELSRGRR